MKVMGNRTRTKHQIKVDRLFSTMVGIVGLIGMGYSLAMGNLLAWAISFIACLVLIRVDKCNNDLEYGRYKLK